MKQRDIKRLKRTYGKQLKRLHKQNISQLSNGLEYFRTHLQFLRDYCILTEPRVIDGHDNMRIATLATAVLEYDAYTNCILNYFKINGAEIIPLTDEPKAELLVKYNAERARHWKYFWQIVMLNIEDWKEIHATV